MSPSELTQVYHQLGIIPSNNKKLDTTDNSLRYGAYNMNTNDRHISKSFDKDLEGAMRQFLNMGDAVALQVAKAVHALTDADELLAQEVVIADNTINNMEVELDEQILLLVAKRQPVANDLRLVMAISKGTIDLERIGDEAVKIAQMARQITLEGNAPKGYSEVQHLSNQARLMVHNALEAFAALNVDKAFDVMRNDGPINQEYQSALRSLMTYIMEDSRHVSKVINIMWVLRALERISDHARNVAELTIHVVSGKDVRHSDFEQVEKAVQEANEQLAAKEANESLLSNKEDNDNNQ